MATGKKHVPVDCAHCGTRVPEERVAQYMTEVEGFVVARRDEMKREAAVLTKRRDSINAQLTDVREMLASVTGAAVAPDQEAAKGESPTAADSATPKPVETEDPGEEAELTPPDLHCPECGERVRVARAEEVIAEADALAAEQRTATERELAALARRRDSINSQVGNVREMLASVAGSSVAEQQASARPAPERKPSRLRRWLGRN